MNIKLLKKIKRRILREPQKFRMDMWTCGTAHCICGWACHLSGVKLKANGEAGELADGGDVETESYRLLGIDDNQGFRLSAIDEWPDELFERYRTTRLRRRRAQIAAERIDRFIATDGRE